MKVIKYLTVLALVGILVGCGHGYEGKYQASNNLFGSFVETAEFVIGSDYLETDGERTKYDDISVRKSGGVKYLVFTSKGEEDAWKIVDKNTLESDLGGYILKFERVK